MFRTGSPDNQVGMGGIVDTSHQRCLRQKSHPALRGATTAIGLQRCPCSLTHRSRSPRNTLEAPSDARGERFDSSALRESLA
jgi:hypothetical protein